MLIGWLILSVKYSNIPGTVGGTPLGMIDISLSFEKLTFKTISIEGAGTQPFGLNRPSDLNARNRGETCHRWPNFLEVHF
jgi:hypothetical protein